mmetsp:Transcript_20871/g.38081  ORF Transcript_20871/g.38081 Transcript_20871/m.38081 type:complete len:720 (-) Transcript_20871:256-2415(-)
MADQLCVESWLRGASAANLYLEGLLVLQAFLHSHDWDAACAACIGGTLAVVSLLHLVEVSAARLHKMVGVAASLCQSVIATAMGLSFGIDIALKLNKGRLSVHLMVFALEHASYVFTFCKAHFGIFFVPALATGAGLVALAWDAVRRLSRSPPHLGVVVCLGVLGAVLACSVLPTLPEYAGDRQGTLAGDVLTDILRKPLARVDARRGQQTHSISWSSESSAPVSSENSAPAGTGLPNLLMFHLEAARWEVLHNANVTPFFNAMQDEEGASEEDVLSMVAPMITMTPMTLKSVWEGLCGTAPAVSADFREHQNKEFRLSCLPRLLRSLGYTTVCAKSDTTLPHIPKVVFGFDEVIADMHPERLVDRVGDWLQSNASAGRPVFIYFFYSGSHSPYHLERLSQDDQYVLPVQSFHEDPTWNVYLNMMHRGDRCANHLVKVLENNGLHAGNSLHFFFGDHGETLPGDSPVVGHRMSPHGSSVTLEQVRTFVLAQFPNGMIQRHQRSKRPGSRAELRRFSDMHATILEVLGLQAGGPLFFGESLLHPAPADRTIFSYNWFDAAQCARRSSNATDLLRYGHADHVDRLGDPDEANAEHSPSLALSVQEDCFRHMYMINDFYRHAVPVYLWAPVHPEEYENDCLVRSLSGEEFQLDRLASGTAKETLRCPPSRDASIASSSGKWIATTDDGQAYEFDAEAGLIILPFSSKLEKDGPKVEGECPQL